MKTKKRSLVTIKEITEYEGLGYTIRNYIGKDLNSTDDELNLIWSLTYDLLKHIEKRLNIEY